MDKNIYTGKSVILQGKVKDLLKNLVSENFYAVWADTFDLEEESEKKIIIKYHGTLPIKEFKKDCKDILKNCIVSVMGSKKKIIIQKQKLQKVMDPKVKKNIKVTQFLIIGGIFACVAAGIVTIMCNYIGNRNFRETFYSVSSLKINNHIRVIHLSDMHGCTFGKNNEKLAERIEKLCPDIIVCTGDMIDADNPDNTELIQFYTKLSDIAPSYYVYGNNEAETVYDIPLNEKALDEKFGFTKETRDETKLAEIEDSFEEELEQTGIKVLKNEKDTLKVGTTNIDIYGVLTSNPSSFWSYSEKSFADYIGENEDNLKITAIHEPFIFEEFSPEFWGDLMVCGHTHGGGMRVPVLGPLYTHEGGLFPERDGDFVYGRYDTAGRPLIVSGGLENKNIFRINNQPELVIIDINKF